MASRLSTSFAAAVVALTLAFTGCSAAAPEAPPTQTATSVPSPTQTETPAPVDTGIRQVATATASEAVAYDVPGGAEIARFANPVKSGAPLVFLVEEAQSGWVRVKLPMRPNGSEGWVPESQLTLATLHYSLEVSTADRTVTLLEDDEPIQTFTAAVGTGDTPTPVGSFYLTELLAPTNHGYGPYAYGISAFSDVLNSFGGGPGQIGMHGTDDSGSIGQAASHGCIRLSNDDITYLAELLPLGTPITIT